MLPGSSFAAAPHSSFVAAPKLPSAKALRSAINHRRSEPRPSTAPGLGVCEWSPEGLKDKSISLIPNIDEILKFVKKKIN